jgi:hypothetical protein
VSYGLVGAYAIYFVLVGAHGNASKFYTLILRDGRGFLPWILAVLVLRGMYTSATLRPFVKPFIALAILTFTLKNYSAVAAQLNAILPASVQLPLPKGATP